MPHLTDKCRISVNVRISVARQWTDDVRIMSYHLCIRKLSITTDSVFTELPPQ